MMVFGRRKPPGPPQGPRSKAFDPAFDHLFAHNHLEGAPYPAAITLMMRCLFFTPSNDWGSYPEPVQHAHYKRLVGATITGGHRNATEFQAAIAAKLADVQSVYICCFEPLENFERDLRTIRDLVFRKTLIDTREQLIGEMIPEAEARAKRIAARPAILANLKASREAEIDIKGETLLDLVRQMGPDDWHEMALTTNWDVHVPILQWIVAQPRCDRGTAVIVMCLGNVDEVAKWMTSYPSREGETWDMVWDIAERLGKGFYADTGLQCGANLTGNALMIETARATGRAPWQFPASILTDGPRKPAPKYTLSGNAVHYHPDYWRTRAGG